MSKPDADSSYPESEKLLSVKDKRDTLHDFVLWLADAKGIHLAVYKGNYLEPCFETTDNILYQYLGIDPKLLEKERSQILEEYRKQHAAQETAPSE